MRLQNLDINQLMKLAEENPDELERLRQREIKQLIDGAPEDMQRRLRGLQFQIDCHRQKHNSSPMGSCMAISRLMIDSLNKLNQALHGTIDDAEQNAKPERKTVASVLSFPTAAVN